MGNQALNKISFCNKRLIWRETVYVGAVNVCYDWISCLTFLAAQYRDSFSCFTYAPTSFYQFVYISKSFVFAEVMLHRLDQENETIFGWSKRKSSKKIGTVDIIMDENWGNIKTKPFKSFFVLKVLTRKY